jgi:hypothetical protein
VKGNMTESCIPDEWFDLDGDKAESWVVVYNIEISMVGDDRRGNVGSLLTWLYFGRCGR